MGQGLAAPPPPSPPPAHPWRRGATEGLGPLDEGSSRSRSVRASRLFVYQKLFLKVTVSVHAGSGGAAFCFSWQVKSGHYVLVKPTPLPKPKLVIYSQAMAQELGLSEDACTSSEFAGFFTGDTEKIPAFDGKTWATPYALSIYGQEMYQNCPFGNGNGYGDGRAVSVAEVSPLPMSGESGLLRWRPQRHAIAHSSGTPALMASSVLWSCTRHPRVLFDVCRCLSEPTSPQLLCPPPPPNCISSSLHTTNGTGQPLAAAFLVRLRVARGCLHPTVLSPLGPSSRAAICFARSMKLQEFLKHGARSLDTLTIPRPPPPPGVAVGQDEVQGR